MTGNLSGGAKTHATIKKLYGSDYYAKIGAIGGSKTHAQGAAPKGFAAVSFEQRRADGIKGGTISRKREKNEI